MARLTNEEIARLHEKAQRYMVMGLRLGQSYMNALNEINVGLSNEILGTDNDPYYLDGNYDNFIQYIYGER